MTAFRVTATVHHGDHYATYEARAENPGDLVRHLFPHSTYMPNENTGRMWDRAAEIWSGLMETGTADWGWVRYTAEELQENSDERSYSIGVPLTVTVRPDGRITFDVDLGEVPLDEGAENGGQDYDDDIVEVDQQNLDRLLAAIRHNLSITL